MSTLFSQENYSELISTGTYPDEVIAQSVYFRKSFTLSGVSVFLRLSSFEIDSPILISCGIRSAYGNDELLNISNAPISESTILDSNVISDSLNFFSFDGITVFSSGTYYFCFSYSDEINDLLYFRFNNSFNNPGKFIKVKYGTGTYLLNSSLGFNVFGEWESESNILTINYQNDTVGSIIRDEL